MHLQLKCCKLSNAEDDMHPGKILKRYPAKLSSFSKTLKSCGTESLERFSKGREAWAFSLLRREKDATHRADESHIFLQSSPAARPSPAQVIKQDSVNLHQGRLTWTYIYSTNTRDVQSGKIDNHLQIISFDFNFVQLQMIWFRNK